MADLVARTATAQDIGARNRQEDALVAHCADSDGPVVAVLSDGMGGHDDGDLASRIIASTMFSEVFVASSKRAVLREHCPQVLRASLNCANQQLRQHIAAGRVSAESGGTLICATILEGQLRWVSVGDSPLYLLRGDRLEMLNQIHSMARQLDLMVSQKQIDAETARKHPDRNCLTAAVTGGAIAKVDCPERSLDLMPADIVLLASDGLNVLPDARIRDILVRHRNAPGEAIADALLRAVRDRSDPNQDNTSIIAIKIGGAEPEQIVEAPGTLARLGQWVIGRAPEMRRRRTAAAGRGL